MVCRCVGSAVVKSSMGVGVPGELARIEATLHLQKLATGFNDPGRTVPVPMRRGGSRGRGSGFESESLQMFTSRDYNTPFANHFHGFCSH